ncbi:MAG: hypothetical protein ACREI1_06325, partial [Nitrospiraceae bacterium]
PFRASLTLTEKVGMATRGEASCGHMIEKTALGGEVIVVDLETNEVLAVHRGYAQYKMDERVGPLNAGWRKRCPPIQPTGGPYGHFILKVLKPVSTSLLTCPGQTGPG